MNDFILLWEQFGLQILGAIPIVIATGVAGVLLLAKNSMVTGLVAVELIHLVHFLLGSLLLELSEHAWQLTELEIHFTVLISFILAGIIFSKFSQLWKNPDNNFLVALLVFLFAIIPLIKGLFFDHQHQNEQWLVSDFLYHNPEKVYWSILPIFLATIILLLIFRKILVWSLDTDFSEINKITSKKIQSIFYGMLFLIIGSSISVFGSLMTMGFLLFPTLVATTFSKSPISVLWASKIIATILLIVGYGLAFMIPNLPATFVIVSMGGAITGLSIFISKRI